MIFIDGTRNIVDRLDLVEREMRRRGIRHDAGAQRIQGIDRPIDFFLPSLTLRHYARDRAPMPRDYDGFPALYVTEQLGRCTFASDA